MTNSSHPDKQIEQSPDWKSPQRVAKIDFALAHRQPTLTVVLENIHDPHNVNAILRSCDAVGVETVHLLYYIESFPRLLHGTSSGTYKWLEYRKYTSVEECFTSLKAAGYHILATKIDATAQALHDFDLTKPTALVLGNEHRGISAEAAQRADELVYIPMMGMAESLNVSVAMAVSLFEAFRQRREAGMYDVPQLSPEALRSNRIQWLLK